LVAVSLYIRMLMQGVDTFAILSDSKLSQWLHPNVDRCSAYA
jgi:hypothetical protein